MHTTNNVPQSRCRAFLIYGELSEMGRWSKRRWRHAEGLHFFFLSLLTSQTREACERVPQHTETHSHTPAQRHERMHGRRHVPPPPFTHTHTHTHTSPLLPSLLPHTDKHTHLSPPPFFFQHNPTLPCIPQQNTHGHIPLPYTHTHANTTKKIIPPPPPAAPHRQILGVPPDPIENAQ